MTVGEEVGGGSVSPMMRAKRETAVGAGSQEREQGISGTRKSLVCFFLLNTLTVKT
jgi:hypothetical protein